ncbi:MAG TPA: hypothetical protein VFT86_01765 [Gaiellaceae bacterium]|nr:hypothetical protein [Gaiellaceae bacterium]
METASVPERSPLKVSPVGIAALLLGLALVSWIVTFNRMRGMDAGPGTELGGLGSFLGIWIMVARRASRTPGSDMRPSMEMEG